MLAIETQVRTLLRQINLKPFTSDNVMQAVEFGIDDLSNKVPFAVAVDRTHGIKGQFEYMMPMDSLEIIEVYYKDAAGVTLNGAISSTSPPAILDELPVNNDITDFPASGTLTIDDEDMSYTAKGTLKFTGITRGVNGTTAVNHLSGAVVNEQGFDFELLSPRTSLAIAQANTAWLSAANGIPTLFYVFGGVLGFDAKPSKTGYFNVLVRHLVRPPALTEFSDEIAGLTITFKKAIVKFAASELAMSLASDEASLTQSREWRAEYLADVAEIKRRKHLYVRGNPGQLIPFTGRS